MDSILQNAIQSAQNAEVAFTKFITANDTGSTGAHQAGYHIHKNAWPLFFDSPGEKGENSDNWVTIKWQNDFETASRFIYYGVGTRNEYRLTRFGKGFPFLSDENVGNLLILCKIKDKFYEAFVLERDDDIEAFLAALNVTISETNRIIEKGLGISPEDKLIQCFNSFLNKLEVEFPSTQLISDSSRFCFNQAYSINLRDILKNPDLYLLKWLEAEYKLFKLIENDRYSERIKTPFSSVEELIEISNTILNRRKSRAGKSLENHLSEIFINHELHFQAQVVTENYKKPDFLFPNQEAYRDPHYDENKLFLLASKTTCKDRWRQVLNEGDRIKTKHLFTLQQGISSNQLDEMIQSNVQLVVPKQYLDNFPIQHRDKLLTLDSFVKMIRNNQE